MLVEGEKTLSLTKYSPYFRIFQNDIMITKESSSLVDSKKDGAAQPPILQLEEPSKGTFFHITLSLNKIDAAINGKQELLAPLILTVPLILLVGPLIIYFFIYFDFAKVIPVCP